MNTLSQWDFQNNHVQNDVRQGKFVGSKSIVLAFGPPKFQMITAGGNISAGDNTVNQTNFNEFTHGPIPVGLVQSFNLSQARQIDKIFELGSERAYLVPGRVIPQFSVSKVLYSGPSLLKFASIYYLQRVGESRISDGVDLSKVERALASFDPDQASTVNFNTKKTPAGYGDFFINLASSLFQLPFGIMVWMKTNDAGNYGCFYLEDAYITVHSMSSGAMASVVAEEVSIEFDRLMPVKVIT